MDIVADLVGQMRLTGGVIVDADLRGEFALISEVAADDWQPYFPVTGSIISYHFVRSGEVWADVEGVEAQRATAGSILIFPQNKPHRLFNADIDAIHARTVMSPPSSADPIKVDLPGEGPETSLYCGFLSATGSHHPLLDLLPPMMIVTPRDERSSEWIESSLRFAAQDSQSMPPQFLGRIAELMFTDGVRSFVNQQEDRVSWLAGMRDPAVSRAIAYIHRNYTRDFDVETLAREVGVSRSVLGERFGALMGEPPMRYAARLRMARAAELLRKGGASAASVGFEVGFTSEAAFSRAFKREFGEPPAAWKRRVEEDGSGEPRASADSIRTCRAPDGTDIAYAAAGDGFPLLKAPNWMTHLDMDRGSPVYGHWVDECAGRTQFIRSDMRGFGRSGRDPADISLDAFVADIGAVADDAGLERFDLLGLSHGAPSAIAYAARYPERVRKLVIVNGAATGWVVRADPDEVAWRRSLFQLNEHEWGRRRHALGELFFILYFPTAGRAIGDWYADRLGQMSTLSTLERVLATTAKFDVRAELAKVRADTLVVHGRQVANTPHQAGREVAERIPGARFVELDSANEVLLRDEPAWPAFQCEFRAFVMG